MEWDRLDWVGQSGQDKHDRTRWDRNKMGQMGWDRSG